MTKPMLTPGSGGGGKAKKIQKTYLPSYISVYIKPSPKPSDPLSSIQPPTSKRTEQSQSPPGVSQSERTVLIETRNAPLPEQSANDEPLPDIAQDRFPADAGEPPWQPGLVDYRLGDRWSRQDPIRDLSAADLAYYLPAQQDDLVRGVATAVQNEGFILHFLDEPIKYLKYFAEYGWDEDSDQAAEEFIQWYVERFRPELERERDKMWDWVNFNEAQEAIQDLRNDENESVVVIDLDTKEILFRRQGGRDSTTLQEFHQKLTEERNIAMIHNHPNNTGASPSDLQGADWLEAEFLIVVNPDGRLHRYARLGDAMIELEPLHSPEMMANIDPLETLATDLVLLVRCWHTPTRNYHFILASAPAAHLCRPIPRWRPRAWPCASQLPAGRDSRSRQRAPA